VPVMDSSYDDIRRMLAAVGRATRRFSISTVEVGEHGHG
jgi:hypothetical protein